MLDGRFPHTMQRCMQPAESEYDREQRWRRDFREFNAAAIRHWYSWITAFFGCVILSILPFYGVEIPSVVVPVVGASGVVVGVFMAWRDQRKAVETGKSRIEELEREAARISLEHAAEIEKIKKPKFKVLCGDDHHTIGRSGFITRFALDTSTGHQTLFKEGIAFFGFKIVNLGATTAVNCRVSLARIERNGIVICHNSGALPLEARNRGDDLEFADIPHDVPQSVTICSILHETDEVCAGTGNLKWRHAPIGGLFNEHGDYIFHVDISADGVLTQHERFTFTWDGTWKTSMISHQLM